MIHDEQGLMRPHSWQGDELDGSGVGVEVAHDEPDVVVELDGLFVGVWVEEVDGPGVGVGVSVEEVDGPGVGVGVGMEEVDGPVDGLGIGIFLRSMAFGLIGWMPVLRKDVFIVSGVKDFFSARCRMLANFDLFTMN